MRSTLNFQPSLRNARRLSKLAPIRGERSRVVNRALDCYFSTKQVPGLPKLVLGILDALERDGCTAAEIAEARAICSEALANQ